MLFRYINTSMYIYRTRQITVQRASSFRTTTWALASSCTTPDVTSTAILYNQPHPSETGAWSTSTRSPCRVRRGTLMTEITQAFFLLPHSLCGKERERERWPEAPTTSFLCFVIFQFRAACLCHRVNKGQSNATKYIVRDRAAAIDFSRATFLSV